MCASLPPRQVVDTQRLAVFSSQRLRIQFHTRILGHHSHMESLFLHLEGMKIPLHSLIYSGTHFCATHHPHHITSNHQPPTPILATKQDIVTNAIIQSLPRLVLQTLSRTHSKRRRYKGHGNFDGGSSSWLQPKLVVLAHPLQNPTLLQQGKHP